MTKTLKEKSSLGKILLAGLGLVAGTYFYSTNKTQENKPVYTFQTLAQPISFEEAKQDTSKRNKYLANLVERIGKPEALREISYQPVLEGSLITGSRGAAMRTSFVGKDIASKPIFDIIVADKGFKSAWNESDLISMLKDHEFKHISQYRGAFEVKMYAKKNEMVPAITKEFKRRIENTKDTLHLIFVELEAYLNQMRNFPEQSSDSLKISTAVAYNAHVKLLNKQNSTPLIESLKYMYREAILIRGLDGTISDIVMKPLK